MADFQHKNVIVAMGVMLVVSSVVFLFAKELHSVALFFQWMNRYFVINPICDWICYGTISVHLLLLFITVSCVLFAVRALSIRVTRSPRHFYSSPVAWWFYLAFVVSIILAVYGESATTTASTVVLPPLRSYFNHFYGELCNGLSYTTIDGLPLLVLFIGGFCVLFFLKTVYFGQISDRSPNAVQLDIP